MNSIRAIRWLSLILAGVTTAVVGAHGVDAAAMEADGAALVGATIPYTAVPGAQTTNLAVTQGTYQSATYSGLNAAVPSAVGDTFLRIDTPAAGSVLTLAHGVSMATARLASTLDASTVSYWYVVTTQNRVFQTQPKTLNLTGSVAQFDNAAAPDSISRTNIGATGANVPISVVMIENFTAAGSLPATYAIFAATVTTS
jgi:hypothetical protein